jgi:23S rRNA U2552 (ribose-2'-O)-methylase RlmE/FtsJ
MWAVAHPVLPSSSSEDAGRVGSRLQHAQSALAAAKQRVVAARDAHSEPAWRHAVHVDDPHHWPLPRDTRRRPPASRAYYKLWEVLRTCAITDVSPSRAALLCEAPGGFAQVVSDLFPAVEWTALSLSDGPAFASALPAHRCLAGDLLTGDGRRDAVRRMGGPGSCGLVTADGASAMDHGALEREAQPLLVAQIATALHLLAPGGTLVVKTFEMLDEAAALGTVASLSDAFDDVSVVKPTHSRPTNSERYVVAVGWRAEGGHRALFDAVADGTPLPLLQPSRPWMASLARIACTLASEQRVALLGAFDRLLHLDDARLFGKGSSDEGTEEEGTEEEGSEDEETGGASDAGSSEEDDDACHRTTAPDRSTNSRSSYRPASIPARARIMARTACTLRASRTAFGSLMRANMTR